MQISSRYQEAADLDLEGLLLDTGIRPANEFQK
jgi:hypothetical protein